MVLAIKVAFAWSAELESTDWGCSLWSGLVCAVAFFHIYPLKPLTRSIGYGVRSIRQATVSITCPGKAIVYSATFSRVVIAGITGL